MATGALDEPPAAPASAIGSVADSMAAGTSPPVGSAVSAGAAPSGASPNPLPSPRFNVLLVLVDSLRADMPWAGYPRDIAPFMTRFEARSVSYTRAYSISSTTARSVAALLASDYPSAMVRDGHFFTRWHPDNVFLAERLTEHGSYSFGAFAHAYFFPTSGLSQGVTDHQVLPGTFLMNTSSSNITSEKLTSLAKEQITAARATRAESGEPFFGYVHYMDPHSPYVPHRGGVSFGSKPRDLYDAEVRHTDHHLGALIDWLDETGGQDDTVVILSADHGESFGEHGHLKHGYELWEELIRVPLMIRVPGAAARRIDTPRSHLDLAPTILALMGHPPGRGMRGHSLTAEVAGAEARPRPVLAEVTRDPLQDRRRALIDGPLKLIVTGDDRGFLLFDVVADPHERSDLVADKPRLEQMKQLYRSVSEPIPNLPHSGDLVPLRGAPEGRRW